MAKMDFILTKLLTLPTEQYYTCGSTLILFLSTCDIQQADS